MAEDPIGFGGGDVNLYGYTRNSPTNFWDSSGESNSVIHFPEEYLGARDAGLGVIDSLNLAGLAVAYAKLRFDATFSITICRGQSSRFVTVQFPPPVQSVSSRR